MRKKYRDLKRKGNVIVFPTTINRLLTDGMNLLKEEKFEEARDMLYQVLSYEPENPAALGAYSYCLYELGEYEEALDVCRELLNVGPLHYLETMELYISILMQVREYEEAEKMLEVLIEENVLPEERLQQFQQLRDLNERIVSKTSIEQVDDGLYSLDHFLTLSPGQQEKSVMELPVASYEALKGKLLEIASHPDIDMLAKTYILFIMRQEKISGTAKIEKFHYNGEFEVAKLPDPVTSDRLNKIKAIFDNSLSKDPTRLEMAHELFDRHVYLMYPFQWDEFPLEEVAEAYMGYLDMLFSGENTISEDDELMKLIIRAEQWFELRNG